VNQAQLPLLVQAILRREDERLLTDRVQVRIEPVLSGTFAHHLLATATHCPHVDAISVNLAPSPRHPLRLKGAAVGATEGAGAADCQRSRDALRDFDVAVNELPITPDRLARAPRESPARRG